MFFPCFAEDRFSNLVIIIEKQHDKDYLYYDINDVYKGYMDRCEFQPLDNNFFHKFYGRTIDPREEGIPYIVFHKKNGAVFLCLNKLSVCICLDTAQSNIYEVGERLALFSDEVEFPPNDFFIEVRQDKFKSPDITFFG